MFKHLIDYFDTSLYVQIWEKRIKVTNISASDIYDEKPLIAISTNKKGNKIIEAIGNEASLVSGDNIEIINPFSHTRSLISNFEMGENLLKHTFIRVLKRSIFRPAPKVVIHPMEKTEGGLTNVEERAFRELALSAGARDVVVYQGHELLMTGFNYEDIKMRSE
ncbi:MAG: rod shape-determining protein [Methylococcales bacterium]|nr:rod shape-determining protein [Methylococcales bacterium]